MQRPLPAAGVTSTWVWMPPCLSQFQKAADLRREERKREEAGWAERIRFRTSGQKSPPALASLWPAWHVLNLCDKTAPSVWTHTHTAHTTAVFCKLGASVPKTHSKNLGKRVRVPRSSRDWSRAPEARRRVCPRVRDSWHPTLRRGERAYTRAAARYAWARRRQGRRTHATCVRAQTPCLGVSVTRLVPRLRAAAPVCVLETCGKGGAN